MERRVDGTEARGETPIPTPALPLEMTFDKSDPEGSGAWAGVVTGDLEGTVVSRVTVLDQSQPVWLVEVGYDIAADEGLLTVRVAGSLNTATGAVRARRGHRWVRGGRRCQGDGAERRRGPLEVQGHHSYRPLGVCERREQSFKPFRLWAIRRPEPTPPHSKDLAAPRSSAATRT